MKLPALPRISFYKHRYVIGYGLYGVLLIILLVLHVTDIPRGLSDAELASATHSATTPLVQLVTTDTINAPYVLLQKASLALLGTTPLAIKLPSIVLGLVTGLALVLMLRRWFSDNIAVVTGIIVSTASPFLSMGRTGTALIMHAFWLSVILFAATKKLVKGDKGFFWKLAFFVSATLSLYTPLMLYPLIAIAVAGLLHPHIRYILKRISITKLAIIGLTCAVLLVPLAWSIGTNPSYLSVLLGLPSAATSLGDIGANLAYLGRVFFDFAHPTVEAFALPLFSAATMILVALGVGKTIVDRYATRSYMLLLWTLLILIVTLLNPSALTILYMPVILFLAIGIETIIREWYRLFPLNPYARVAGLIPLAILLVSVSASNIAHYFYGYLYLPDSSRRTDLSVLRTTLELPALKDKPITIVSLPQDSAFFGVVARDYETLSTATTPVDTVAQIITEDAYRQLPEQQRAALGTPYRLVTRGGADDPLAYRVYVSE